MNQMNPDEQMKLQMKQMNVQMNLMKGQMNRMKVQMNPDESLRVGRLPGVHGYIPSYSPLITS